LIATFTSDALTGRRTNAAVGRLLKNSFHRLARAWSSGSDSRSSRFASLKALDRDTGEQVGQFAVVWSSGFAIGQERLAFEGDWRLIS
jgi:hypothetical protein